MEKEDLKIKVEEILKNMGCEDIIFSDDGDSGIEALFNCKEVVSFKTPLSGWTYSGIQLDESKRRQYKIYFKKIETIQQMTKNSAVNYNNTVIS